MHNVRTQSRDLFRSVPVLDVPLAIATYDEVVELVRQRLASPLSGTLTADAVNTMGLTESCLDQRMHEALLAYDLILPDGMPLVWCMNAKGAELSDRVYGPYLVERVLAGLPRLTRVALIGGFHDMHKRLERLGATRFRLADFVLLYEAPTGPIDAVYVEDCLSRIAKAEAELVFVCLGVPRQYYWMALARPHLRGKTCFSVGGAFDLVVGEASYAPAWVQRAGLTWLHRMRQDPWRLGRRYFKYNPRFIWLLLTREVLAGRLPLRATPFRR